MKKISFVLTTVIAAIFTQNTFAQTDVVTLGNRVYETKKFRFGAFISPSLSSMKPTASKSDDGLFANEKNGTYLGFSYGLMAEYWFADNYALVSGIHHNMTKGSIVSQYVGNGTSNVVKNADITYRLNYVEVPLHLKMSTDPISNFKFFGQAGFSLSANISKKYDYNINYLDKDGISMNVNSENEKIRGTLSISPILLSMNIGIGAEYPINNKLAAYGGLFFNNGFLPDVTNPAKYQIQNVPEFRDGNTRLNNFALRIGIFF